MAAVEMINVKAELGQDIRKFRIPPSLDAIRARLQQLYKLSPGFDLKYKDEEEDMVTMASDEDLQIALLQDDRFKTDQFLRVGVFLTRPVQYVLPSGNRCMIEVSTAALHNQKLDNISIDDLEAQLSALSVDRLQSSGLVDRAQIHQMNQKFPLSQICPPSALAVEAQTTAATVHAPVTEKVPVASFGRPPHFLPHFLPPGPPPHFPPHGPHHHGPHHGHRGPFHHPHHHHPPPHPMQPFHPFHPGSRDVPLTPPPHTHGPRPEEMDPVRCGGRGGDWKKHWRSDRRTRETEDGAASDTPRQRRHLARFVKHVTVPDGTVVAPSAQLQKTWRFRNESSSAWPMSCALVRIGGDAQIKGSDTMDVGGGVPSGQECDVTVSLIAPESSGYFQAFFRLQEKGGRKFGQRVWISVIVTTSSEGENDDFVGVDTSADWVGEDGEEGSAFQES